MCIQYKNIVQKCQSPEQTRKYILHKLVSCIRTSYNKRTLIFNEKKTFPPVTMEKKDQQSDISLSVGNTNYLK